MRRGDPTAASTLAMTAQGLGDLAVTAARAACEQAMAEGDERRLASVRRGRCAWAGTDPRMVAYHDTEWGTPLHDEDRLFELLCLEGAQAGLSWSTVLNRRDGYRAAYDGFDAARIAAYDDARQAALLADPRIIRNRAKVHAFRENARAVLALRAEVGGLEPFLWAFVDGAPIVNRWAGLADLPASTELSVRVEQGAGQARLPVRGAHDRLRVPPVGRPGERPHARLLPPPRQRRQAPPG